VAYMVTGEFEALAPTHRSDYQLPDENTTG